MCNDLQSSNRNQRGDFHKLNDVQKELTKRKRTVGARKRGGLAGVED